MTKKLFFIALYFFVTYLGFAQNSEEFWDAKHATTETVKVKAGESFVFKTADLPTGTTEVLYRIKIVETNSKITESLVSILKAIPDPTGISQGTAGVFFLTTTITGKDKFDYALFTSINDANIFVKTKKSNQSCFQSSESSSADSKIINFDNQCFNNKTKNLIFVISSKNWILDQSVLVEVVPFVNKKLARGWKEETKLELLALAKSESIYKSVKNKNGFGLQFKNFIEDRYTYTEFQQLLPIEKTGLKEEAIRFALQKNDELALPMQLARLEAEKALLSNNFVKAINLYQNSIFSKKLAVAKDYYNLSTCFLATKQLENAKNLILEGKSLHPDNLQLQLALANYFLITNNWKECKQIHKAYSNQNLDATTEWSKEAIEKIAVFRLVGLENKTFKKLENFLKK
jgi:hypothetical protein